MSDVTRSHRVTRRSLIKGAAVGAGLALVGCAQPAPTPAPTAVPQNTPASGGAPQPTQAPATAVPVAKNVKLRYWATPPFTTDDVKLVYEPLMGKFRDANPNIEMEVEVIPSSGRREKMMTAFAGGQAADVASMNIDMVWMFTDAGALAPLDDVVPPEFYEDTPKASQEMARINGKLYMLHYNGSIGGHVYNKALMEEVGWDPAKPPETWDDLLKFGPMAKAKGLYSIHLPIHDFSWQYYVWQNNGRILREDADGNVVGSAIDSQEVRETWEWLKEHYANAWCPREYITEKVTDATPNYFLQKKQVVSNFGSAQGLSTMIGQVTDIEWELMPCFLKKRKAEGGSDTSLAMMSSCKDFQAGGRWLQFLMTPDIMAEWANLGGFIPARVAATKSPAWKPSRLLQGLAGHLDAVASNKDRYFYYSQASAVLRPELHAFILGSKTLDAAIKAGHDALEQLIQDDLKAKGQS